jgi:PAS domain S-box-containing protein
MGRAARRAQDPSEALQAMKRRVAELERLEGRQGDMEAALRDSEARFRFLYEQNPSMYFTVDTSGTVLSVNPFGADQLGYGVDDLVGKPVLQVFHPDDRAAVVEQLRVCAGDAGKAFSWELRKVHRDGRVLWVREVARAVHDRDDRIVVLIVCEDVTGRRAVEEALRAARDEMERRVAERTEELREREQELRVLAGRLLTAQEDERRRLAREMHDDVTQRLMGLALQVSLAQRARGLSPAEVSELLRTVGASIAQLSTDVHALSRRLHPSILAEGLADAIENECEGFAKQGLAVEFRASDVPSDIDRATAICLYRITQEALRNVAKHARTKQARVSLSAASGFLVLCIEDGGVGFDAARARGVGLGLASMEERARLVGAQLAVESRIGQGSAVRVRVPLARGASGGG